jgi:hypothetical protein
MGFVARHPSTQQQCCIATEIQDGINTTPNAATQHADAQCMVLSDPPRLNTTRTLEVSYDSAISGGVRLNCTIATRRTKGVAILFAGMANQVCGEITTATTAALETCGVAVGSGGLGTFEPDLVLFLTSDEPGGSATVETDASPSFGVAINGGSQVHSYVDIDDADEPTDADGVLRSARSIGWLERPSTWRTARITSFASSGFNYQSDSGSPRAHYLALKFTERPSLAAANVAVSGSTGDQALTVGFPPSVVIGMSTLLAAEDTETDGATASTFGYFVTGALGSRAYSAHHQEGLTLAGATVSNSKSRQEDVAVLTYEHAGAVAQRATWVSAGGSGFTLNFSAATAGHLTVLAIGAADIDLAVSDTEQITDNVTFAGLLAPQSDTVQITDSAVLFTTDVSVTEGPQGTSYSAGSERGTSFQGGAEEGTVM